MISIIAVISRKNRAIGYKNKLLWNLWGDLIRLKEITSGHTVIMGRLTFESIGSPLPNRTNIVVTKSDTIQEKENLLVAKSVGEALYIANKKNEGEIFIIGGEQIFKQSINLADRLYLTIVDDEPKADTFFPNYADFKKIVLEEKHPEHTPPFTYLTLER